MAPIALGAFATLFASSCKTSNPEVPRLAKSQASQAEPLDVELTDVTEASTASTATPEPVILEPVVARIGNSEVLVSELLTAWMLTDSLALRDMLENLVTSRLVSNEAERIGIEISSETLGAEYSRALAGLESDLQEQQPGLRLDEWIAGNLGLDPARYRIGVREDVRRRLLAERVVRHFIYTQDWAEVRVLVVETREEAEAALARLKADEPFARIAGELSIDPSGRAGGRIPPVVRNESTLSRLAYSTEVGQFGGPVLEADKWLVLEPIEFHPALVGDWAQIGPEIVASLAGNAVAEPEYWLWKVEMSERHPADFEPFFELIGEPTDTAGP